jgi:hypothetical protein
MESSYHDFGYAYNIGVYIFGHMADFWNEEF